MLMNKGYDIENIPLSQLDKIAKDESILQDKKVSALENKVNKPISVDEYIVTIWTGGQYPAAPPYIIL